MRRKVGSIVNFPAIVPRGDSSWWWGAMFNSRVRPELRNHGRHLEGDARGIGDT